MRAKSIAMIVCAALGLTSVPARALINTPACNNAARSICPHVSELDPGTGLLRNIHKVCSCGQRLIYDVDLQQNVACDGATSNLHNFGLVVCESGIRIDGNGRSISLVNASQLPEYSDPGNDRDIYGVLIDGPSAGSLRNVDVVDLVVQGFHRGIRIANATRTDVLGVHVHHNDLFATSYGIDIVSGSEGTRVQSMSTASRWQTRVPWSNDPVVAALRSREINCFIHANGDEGIHVGTGAYRTKIQSCAVANNGTENVYLQASERTEIRDVCTWHANDESFAGTEIKIDNASDNRIRGSVFQGNVRVQASSYRPFYWLGRSYRDLGADVVRGRIRVIGSQGSPGGAPTDMQLRSLSIYGRQSSCLRLERDSPFPMPTGGKFSSTCLYNCGSVDLFADNPGPPAPLAPNRFSRLNTLTYAGPNPYVECGSSCIDQTYVTRCAAALSAGDGWPAGCSPTQPGGDLQRIACCDRYWQ